MAISVGIAHWMGSALHISISISLSSKAKSDLKNFKAIILVKLSLDSW